MLRKGFIIEKSVSQKEWEWVPVYSCVQKSKILILRYLGSFWSKKGDDGYFKNETSPFHSYTFSLILNKIKLILLWWQDLGTEFWLNIYCFNIFLLSRVTSLPKWVQKRESTWSENCIIHYFNKNAFKLPKLRYS